jgi:hypothetical protein
MQRFSEYYQFVEVFGTASEFFFIFCQICIKKKDGELPLSRDS